MSKETLEKYRDENTREITMQDGSRRAVRMTPELWKALEFLKLWEIITETELAEFAEEEIRIQNVSFDRAFRGLVATVSNLWAENGKLLYSGN